MIGSVYSGVGGLDIAVSMATGMSIAWLCESAEFPRKVLAKRFPGVPCYESDEKIPDRIASVSVLTGGPPCQPISMAGKKRGRLDERWRWPQFLSLVRRIRPEVVFVENPANLLRVDGGERFGEILGSMAEVGMHAEWACVRASDAGLPHRRERLFLLAYTDSGRLHWKSTPRVHDEGAPWNDAYGRGVHVPGPADKDAWREAAVAGVPQPGLLRGPDGVPGGMDTVYRLKSIGNAVSPPQAILAWNLLIDRM